MPDSYHHGDLRRTLLNEAGSVLEDQGIAALSLRDLARRAGVSATAPYHHFKGKADLVCALSEDALLALDAELAAPDHADPRERMRAQGVAYVLFAVEHPERFRLAFRPDLGDPFEEQSRSKVLDDTTIAFRQLIRVVREIEPDPDRQLGLAMTAWSAVHGLAALLVDGPLRPVAADRDRVRALAEDVTRRIRL
ncbi:MAG: TetR/AcrR family transcriptional regulator [Bacteroidota bacterium]